MVDWANTFPPLVVRVHRWKTGQPDPFGPHGGSFD